jgi:hypothetical protein
MLLPSLLALATLGEATQIFYLSFHPTCCEITAVIASNKEYHAKHHQWNNGFKEKIYVYKSINKIKPQSPMEK